MTLTCRKCGYRWKPRTAAPRTCPNRACHSSTWNENGRPELAERHEYHCLKCGHEWFSRLARAPKVCPQCNSGLWEQNKPKSHTKEETQT